MLRPAEEPQELQEVPVIPSEASKETARNILLSRSIEIATQAVQADKTGDLAHALDLYTDAVQLLMLLLKNEDTESRRVLFRGKATELLSRAEEIKSILAARAPPSTAGIGSVSENDHAPEKETISTSDCELVLNVDGVACFSMISTSERHLIAEGSLQLLKTDHESGLHLLRLGEFEFPLLPAVPCLRVARGFYMVPMPEGNVVYGFVFPQSIPDAYLDLFESKLTPICAFKTKSEGEAMEQAAAAARKQMEAGQQVAVIPQNNGAVSAAVPLSKRVANTVFVGSQVVVSGIQAGTEKIGTAIHKGGELLKSKLKSDSKPAEVNAALASTIHVASVASPYVVKLSSALVTGLLLVAEKIGEAAANSIMESPIGIKINSGKSFIGPEKIAAAKEVGKAGLAAVANVWDALETSGRALVSQLSDSTVSVVEHKYGQAAAKVTGESLSVAVDLVETAYNVKQIGVKKLIKRAGRSAGTNYVRQMLEDQHAAPALEAPPEKLLLTNGTQ